MLLHSHSFQRIRRIRFAVILSVLFLVMAAALPGALTPNAAAQDDDETSDAFDVDNASLRWGINIESSTKGLAPNTYNFMSAGDISGTFGGPYEIITQSQWKATDGNVTIEKRSSSDTTSVATWNDIQTKQDGSSLGQNGDYSGLEALFVGGEGTVDPDAGTAKIEFEGAITILYYSGYVYSTITDPYVEITPSSAKIKATMGGHQSSRDDTDLWEKLDPVPDVTIADLGNVDISQAEPGTEHKGFSVDPKWDHVTYSNPASGAQVKEDASGVPWGSFPKDFVDFQVSAGSGEYWYTSGGGPDKSKKPMPLTVSWDADDPFTPIESGANGGSDYESILRALLDDVVDATGNWAGEATTNGIKQTLGNMTGADVDAADSEGAADGGTDASGGTGGTSGGTGDSSFNSNGTYSGSSNVTSNYYSNYAYTDNSGGGNAQPSTNGTQQYNAGSAQTSYPSSGIQDPPTSYDGIGASYVADNPDSPVTYALTSADSALSGIGRNWQWWLGGLMLASALGTVLYTTLRGKA